MISIARGSLSLIVLVGHGLRRRLSAVAVSGAGWTRDRPLERHACVRTWLLS